ncbi:hypothetical protein V6N11_055348 [Hibiscus sabdariffa]|uniref:Uncharacterized protein n=1 Tax=Hibiscus sabdariffa TaxID=183260 RepID=A0ABR2PFK2_9ROSI
MPPPVTADDGRSVPDFTVHFISVPLSLNPTFILLENALKSTAKRLKVRKPKGFNQDSQVSGHFSVKQPPDLDSACQSESPGAI